MAKESVVVSVRLPVALAAKLAAEAKRQDRAQGWVARKAIKRYLTGRKP